jgi:hypothetical protein
MSSTPLLWGTVTDVAWRSLDELGDPDDPRVQLLAGRIFGRQLEREELRELIRRAKARA